jgi:putative nucleotidyltransferase with HDIG domain
LLAANSIANQENCASVAGGMYTIPSEVLRIIGRLQSAGHQAVLAGGCVRDMLRDAMPHDWDIATSARPEEVEGLFARTVPVGKQFGIILVLGDSGTPYEVATFRKESDYADGRHPNMVSFAAMEEDVKRRDFTVNALLYDPITEQLLDFVGGVADLKQGILRTVGNPEERFYEDRLRMLRAPRFAANLHLQIVPETWDALKRYAHTLLPAVSQERIRDEVEKMLVNGASRDAFQMLQELGLLGVILPELSAEVGVAQPPEFHPEGDVWQHQLKLLGSLDETTRRARILEDAPTEGIPATERFDDQDRLATLTRQELRWLCWGALLHDIGKPLTYYMEENGRIRFFGHDVKGEPLARKRMTTLRLDGDTVDNAAYLVRHHMEVVQLPLARVAKQRRMLQQPLFPLLLEVVRLDTLSSFGNLELHHKIAGLWREEQSRPHPPKPLITGKDLLALGLKPGPIFGEILQKCQDYELENPFPDREEALKWLRAKAKDFAPAGIIPQ